MDFIEKVRQLPIHDIKLISFDFNSVMTKVLHNEVLDFLKRNFSASHRKKTFPGKRSVDPIRRSGTNNIFIFGGEVLF